MTLADLRAAAQRSYAWRTKKGQTVTEAEYDSMPEDTPELKSAKAKYRWLPDPKLVDALVTAEREQTATIYVARTVFA